MYAQFAKRLVRPLKFVNRQLRLPEASIVTEFLIRRQHFRDISTPSLRKLLESLPSLRILRRENWRLITQKERVVDDRRYALQYGASKKTQDGSRYLLTTALPRSLIHLQLFEDFERQLHGKRDCERSRLSLIELLPSLAILTPRLQHLAVSFLTDAIDCFGLRRVYLSEGAIPDHMTHLFPHLENVILTSQEHLRPTQTNNKTNALLRAAAAIALKMPKLKVLEIWNCGQGHACLFRYDSTLASSEHVGVITWRSNWMSFSGRDLVIETDVLKAWEKVIVTSLGETCHLLPEPIRFKRMALPVGHAKIRYLSYHSIIEHLKLAGIALHPTSKMQVRCDAIPTPEKMIWYQ
jgi:hypothetical protein